MINDINKQIKLLSELVSIDTSEGKYANFDRSFKIVNSYLQPLGLIPFEYSENDNRSCVWTNSSNHLQPDVLLSAHIDVVPASIGQFTIEQIDHKVFGRGVSDMKFSIVSYISILQSLHAQNQMPKSIAVMITTDEESVGLNGTNYLVNQIGYRPKLVFLPDGGENLELVIGSKGVLSLKVIASGSTAHSCYPWDGDSAIDNLVNFLVAVREVIPNPTEESWSNTINSGHISGGVQTNQICEQAEVHLDIRYIPGTDVGDLVSKIANISPKIKVEVLDNFPPFHVDSQNDQLIRWQNIVKKVANQKVVLNRDHGASDANYFSALNIPVIMTKPSAGGDHSTNEWLDVNSWQIFNQCLTNFLCS